MGAASRPSATAAGSRSTCFNVARAPVAGHSAAPARFGRLPKASSPDCASARSPAWCSINERNASCGLQRRDSAQIGRDAGCPGQCADRPLFRFPQTLGGDPHQVPCRLVDIGVEMGLILECIAVDVPAACRDAGIKQACVRGREALGQGGRHLVAAHRATLGDLFQRIAPPLQAHLGNHAFCGDPRRAADLNVEGIERKKRRTHRKGRRHHRAKPVGISGFDDPGAGIECRIKTHRSGARGQNEQISDIVRGCAPEIDLALIFVEHLRQVALRLRAQLVNTHLQGDRSRPPRAPRRSDASPACGTPLQSPVPRSRLPL